MKIGDSIREIREVEKNFKRSYVAQQLHITTRAYTNIENNVAEITLNRLEAIAEILECSALYILNYKKSKVEYFNNIHNNNGNQGVIHINQSTQQTAASNVEALLRELLQCERKRINLLEALLRNNNIEF
ncbi:MAG TPA: helix-turn-helix transcriptional regulator [Arachidicoccus sp.]